MSQVNDIKVRLKLAIYEDGVALDISAATAKTIIITKPDGTQLMKMATFLTDGTDSLIYYDTISGDLDQSGLFKVQGLILISGGTYYSSISSFKVLCNL